MWVKICANTTLADAQLAAELGADAVGFVFAPSKRRVTVEQVAAITPQLPGSVEKVGVFDQGEAAELERSALRAGLTALQLHSEYDPVLVRTLNEASEAHLKLIQVVKVPVDGDGDAAMVTLAAALRDPGLFAVLLDAAKAGISGGLGVPFSWSTYAVRVHEARAQAAIYARRNDLQAPKLMVAGGLDAGNVGEALATLQPDGVDVASGVEEKPGKKSPAKLRAFQEAARRKARP